MNKYGYIYKICNKVNGKVYFGKKESSTLVEDYWGSGKNIRKALDKYGVENFTRTVVDWADTKQDLDLKEKFWIAFGRQHYDCYNISDGGDGGPTRRGQHHTDETKRKISESHKGKVMSDEARRNMSLNHADFKGEKSPCWGKHPSDEARRKMSETHKLVDAGKNQQEPEPMVIFIEEYSFTADKLNNIIDKTVQCE